jgi:hypothetical protein
MHLFVFIFNVFFYGFCGLFQRKHYKLRAHHLGEWKDVPDLQSTTYHTKKFFAYMYRWIFQIPFGGVRLQKITRSDLERHLHNHPFDFMTIRLWGNGYYEETPAYGNGITPENWVEMGMPTKLAYHKPFSILFRRANDLHRLSLKDEKPQWTLFIHGPCLQDWGFHTENGWVQWEEYEKNHKELTY